MQAGSAAKTSRDPRPDARPDSALAGAPERPPDPSRRRPTVGSNRFRLLLFAGLVQAVLLLALADPHQIPTLSGAFTLLPPLAIIGATLALAFRARSRAADLHDLLDAELSDVAALSDSARLEDLVASLTTSASGPTPGTAAFPPTSPLFGQVLDRLTENVAAGKHAAPFDARAEVDALWKPNNLTATATLAVTLGLVGTFFRFAVQVYLSAGGAVGGAVIGSIYGESMGASVLIAVVTTIQGFLTAAFVGHLDAGLGETARALGQQVARFLNLRVFPHLRPADSPAGELEAALLRSEARVIARVAGLGTTLPSWVTKNLVTPAVDTLSGALCSQIAPVTKSITDAQLAISGSLARVEQVTTDLVASLKETGNLVLAAVATLNAARQTPEEMAGVMRAAAKELESARARLAPLGPWVEHLVASTTDVAQQLATAVAALNHREVAAAGTVTGLEQRVDNLVRYLERLGNAMSQFSQAAFHVATGQRATNHPTNGTT